MSKHSKGPWIADFQAEQISSEDCVIVYELGTNEADAHLICAAPDLYKAAWEARGTLDSIRAGSMSRNNQESMIDEAIEALDAAIAKAKGESQ